MPAVSCIICVSALGYESVIKEDARVLLDLTTPVDFEIGQRSTEITEPIIVTAERPLIQKDLTGTLHVGLEDYAK